MKYFRIFLVIVPFIFSINLSAQGRFEISGIINTQFDDATISLGGNFESFYTIIGTIVKDGKFYLTGIIDEKYKPVSLTIKKSGSSHSVHFFITNTKMKITIKKLSINDSLNRIIYSNIPFIEIQKVYERFIRDTEDSIHFLYNYKKSIQNSSPKVVDSIEFIYNKTKDNLLKKRIKFIKAHYDNYFSLYQFNRYVLNTSGLDANDLYSIYLGFSNQLKMTSEGRSTYNLLKKKKTLLIDNLMPDFSFKTNLGQIYSLTQFRGKKYILLCFWASWCKPCIKNIPMLNEINDSFSLKGLQLVSISIDNNKNHWLSALGKFKMPWMQSCDIKEFIEKKVRVLYDINWIPQYFLIDKNGRLIYQNFLANDSNSYSGLKKMLNTCMP